VFLTTIKPDSILVPFNKIPFYERENSMSFVLDDYKKFKTMKEVFIEIVDPVYYRIQNKKIVFKLKIKEDYFYEDLRPLILMDGIYVQDYNSLLTYEAKKVKKVVVLYDRVFFNSLEFRGVIAIETFNNNYKNEINKNEIVSIELTKPQLVKKYFKQRYIANLNKTDRIPDYRNQLLWQPNFKVSSSINNFSFFTSYITGKYEIVLEGFSTIGEAVSLKKIISVGEY